MKLAPWFLVLAAGSASAQDLHLAVAANFAAPIRQLAAQFDADTGYRTLLSIGSTGKFYTQIKSAAPFDILLAADSATPRRLVQEQLAAGDSRFTYAIGKLVLWSPTAGLVDPQGQVLRAATFKRLAIANPKIAPYGAAAQQAMEQLGVWPVVRHRLVMGENIAQTLQFVASGNAELGFIALSQLRDAAKPAEGSMWLVPQALYSPIRQDAVLLTRASANKSARQFLAFLRSAPARRVIGEFGYDLP